jgi:hypothetical protein
VKRGWHAHMVATEGRTTVGDEIKLRVGEILPDLCPKGAHWVVSLSSKLGLAAQ